MNTSRAAAIAGLLFLVHTAGLVYLFAPPAGLFNGQAVLEQDWGVHFFHLESLNQFWRKDRRLWGYNPYFMAGFPSNTIQDGSIKFQELLTLAAPASVSFAVFKIVSFLLNACIPWMLWLAARNLFGRKDPGNRAACWAALLGTAYWWNSLPREMFFYGMVSFAAGSYFWLFSLSLLFRVLQAEKKCMAVHLAWVVSVAVLLPLHPQCAAIMAPAALALMIVQKENLNLVRIAWIVGAGSVALMINLPWLYPFLSHWKDNAAATQVASLPLFYSTDPFAFLKDYLTSRGFWSFRSGIWEKGLRLAVLILGVQSIRLLFEKKERVAAVTFSTAVASLFVLTYFGSQSDVFKLWQPMRFKVPMDASLAVVSGFFLSGLRRETLEQPPMRFAAAVLGVALLTFAVNVRRTETGEKLPLRGRQMRLRTIPSKPILGIVEWIRTRTSPEMRVLFEESGDETGHMYDGMYLSSFIPRNTGRQLIGGPFNLYFDRHHFAEFHSGQLFKKPISKIPPKMLKAYLEIYNIGAIVTFHPESIKVFSQMSELIKLDRKIGPFHMALVNRRPNWFLQGRGQVRVEMNRIRCEQVEPADGAVVLKYHWVEGLTSVPPLTIEPIPVADDPIPFIKVPNPPASFTLRVGR